MEHGCGQTFKRGTEPTMGVLENNRDQPRSKSSALSSAETDQICGGANLFLGIALNELSTLVCPIYSH